MKAIKRGRGILRIRGVLQKDFVNTFFIRNSYFHFRLKVAKKLLTKFKVNLEQENTDLVQGRGSCLVVSLIFTQPNQAKRKSNKYKVIPEKQVPVPRLTRNELHKFILKHMDKISI